MKRGYCGLTSTVLFSILYIIQQPSSSSSQQLYLVTNWYDTKQHYLLYARGTKFPRLIRGEWHNEIRWSSYKVWSSNDHLTSLQSSLPRGRRGNFVSRQFDSENKKWYCMYCCYCDALYEKNRKEPSIVWRCVCDLGRIGKKLYVWPEKKWKEPICVTWEEREN